MRTARWQDESDPQPARLAQRGGYVAVVRGGDRSRDGAAGVVAGAAATAIYAHTKGWAVVIPAQAWAGGLAAALLIGALAGLLPALKAARLSPTEALWTL